MYETFDGLEVQIEMTMVDEVVWGRFTASAENAKGDEKAIEALKKKATEITDAHNRGAEIRVIRSPYPDSNQRGCWETRRLFRRRIDHGQDSLGFSRMSSILVVSFSPSPGDSS